MGLRARFSRSRVRRPTPGRQMRTGRTHSERASSLLTASGKEVVATATHYEILGVDPDASHDEVKRAFTGLALRWHPDRQSEPGPEARERAEWRMQEINAAWEVLRNPAARAAYDEQLAAAGGAGAPSVPAHRQAAPGGVGGRPPSFADQLVDPTRADPRDERVRRGGLRRWAPVLVIAVVVSVVTVLAVHAAHKSSAPPPPGVELQTEQFQVGSCVAVTPGPEAVTGPCNEPNRGQIAATTDYPRPCPPDTTTVALVERHISLCLVPS